MKIVLVAEYRDKKLLASCNELMDFANRLDCESVMCLVGSENALPGYDGKLYLADVEDYGEYNPDGHKQFILDVAEKEQADMVAFSHSSYGWDLAPRVAFALKAAQVSEIVEVVDGVPVVPVCNGKLRRDVQVKTEQSVVTIQAGAFGLSEDPTGTPTIEKITGKIEGRVEFTGYEQAQGGGVDLGKAQVIVSAGRGIGKPENVVMIANLAKALGGE